MYSRLPTSDHPAKGTSKKSSRGANIDEGSPCWQNSRKSRKTVMAGAAAPPKHVHCNDWREMLALTVGNLSSVPNPTSPTNPNPVEESHANLSPSHEVSGAVPSISEAVHMRARAASTLSLRQNTWIEHVFKKRECCKFIASSKYPNKCGCGRLRHVHSPSAVQPSYVTSNGVSGSPSEERSPRLDAQYRNGNAAEFDGVPSMRRATRAIGEKWTIRKHTIPLPTDAYGTIEFQGGPHPSKAQYLRLNVETDPADIMNLFENVWQMPAPQLIITVHGGITNFDLQSKLARVFRKGLLKAAKTTGAWIITSGINMGVVRHVAAALEGTGTSSRSRPKVVSIGITPWGLLKRREDFLGQDVVIPYHPHSFSTKGRFVLNNRHTHFLLVDNGTVGRYGADIILRKRLETYIAEKQKIGGGARGVPVVCVVLEGGTCTIRAVLDYVTNTPKVPVVVCDGSGRAADLLAFAHQIVKEHGRLPEAVKPQLLNLVESVFGYDERNAEVLLLQLMMCAQQKHLITVFRLGENQKQDVDHAILTALLKGQNLSSSEQLALALAWNRVDIARSDIFVLGQDWPKEALNNAMMEALMNDRVDFVRLLLENGVSMHKFLTVRRLEELYNTDKGPSNTLHYIVRDVVKIRAGYRYRIPHIGLAIEKLMGNGFKSTYTTEPFRAKYLSFRNKIKMLRKRQREEQMCRRSNASEYFSGGPGGPAPTALRTESPSPDALLAIPPSSSRSLSSHLLWKNAFRRDNPGSSFNSILPLKAKENKETVIDIEDDSNISTIDETFDDFKYPFSDLLLWAVLTKRQEMALCMWQHGEEALAKALVACMLYKSLAKEAAEDYLEVEICDELKTYAEEFRKLSVELLGHCYLQDDDITKQLLTYELSHWGNENCLSLAVLANNKQFVAHPCCQVMLADLWHGGLRIRSHSNLKVVLGLLFPPSIFLLEFKSREELMLQPQTAAEHEEDINDSSSSSSSSSSDSESSDSDYSSDESTAQNDQTSEKRKNSSDSLQSLNLAGLFQSRRRRGKQQPKDSNAALNTPTPNHQAVGEFVNSTTITLASSAGATGFPGSLESARRPRATSVNSQHSQNLFPMIRKASSRQSSVAKGCKRDHHRHHSDSSSISRSQFGGGPGSKAIGHRHHRRSIDHGAEPPNLAASSKAINAFGQNVQRTRPIKCRRKLYEFYVAPVSTFWAWTLSFCAFICCCTYSLLIKTPPVPSALEWVIFAYMVTFGMEHLRKYLMSEPESFAQKTKHFFGSIWNAMTAFALVTYFIGFGLRVHPPTSTRYGRVILASNYVLWSVKLLDFISVHPRMGPYITMAGKMVISMTYIIVLLFVSLLGFGLARQSITYPNEEWHWLLLRNVFYKPYFMLYGEVYAGEIDTCGDEAWDRHEEEGIPINELTNGTFGEDCVPGFWVPPLLMTVFLLMSNLLLISMLLAIFNNIFATTDKIAREVWFFQRYRQVMEYESTPFLPPPLTPIYHLWMIIRFLRLNKSCHSSTKNSSKSKKNLFDFTLKLFLNEDQVEKLHDFEEDCMDDMARQKEFEKNTSNEERIHRTAERSDMILVRLNDLSTKEALLKDSVRELDNRLELIESKQNEVLDCMRHVVSMLPVIVGNPSQAAVSPQPPSAPPAIRVTSDSEPGSIEQTDEVESATTAGLAEPGHVPSPKLSLPVDINLKGDRGNDNQVVAARRRTRNSTVTGCDDISSQSPVTNDRISRFGSLISLDPTVLSQIIGNSSKRKSPCGSMRRRRRHEEYTSITDAINVSDILPQIAKLVEEGRHYGGRDNGVCGSNTEDEEEEIEDEESPELLHFEGYDTPNTTLKRAKKSFVLRQNTVFKEYEEEISQRIRDAILQHVSLETVGDHADDSSLTEPEIKEDYIEFTAKKELEDSPLSSRQSVRSCEFPFRRRNTLSESAKSTRVELVELPSDGSGEDLASGSVIEVNADEDVLASKGNVPLTKPF